MLGWPRWSLDSSHIASGCIFVESGINTPARIWDVETSEPILTFTQHQGQVDGEGSPDGLLIATTDYAEQLAKIWHSKDGTELFNFHLSGAPLTFGWSPDGTQIIVTGDGMNEPIIKRVWRSADEMIEHAYECLVSRKLTPEERSQFGLPPKP